MVMLKKLAAVASMAMAISGSVQAKDDAINCDNCAKWNKPAKPFNIYGNTWYVGVEGLSAVLVTGPQGHILVDAGLPQSAALIEANIKALGFKIEDVKLIVNSHAHWDHAGGIAALQRASGAVVAATASSAATLRSGVNGKDDPQYDPGHMARMPVVRKVRVVGDGQTLNVGPLAITAHATPGHTPGATTWSWPSCEAGRCVDVVYADSLTPVSSHGFHFTGKGKTPDISRSFEASVAKVGALKCDIILSSHPDATDTLAKAAARTPARNPFVAADGCKAYAATVGKKLAERLAHERGER
jgi:metallo-beta-lactamase class B